MVCVFYATFNNISVISWRSVLLVEETGVPGENNRPATSTLRLSGIRATIGEKYIYLSMESYYTFTLFGCYEISISKMAIDIFPFT
jgi:hypothetical protein